MLPCAWSGQIDEGITPNTANPLVIIKQKTLTMHVSSICPFQCLPSENDGKLGIFNDVSQAVFKAAGFKSQPVYAPFSRAIVLAQQGKLDILTVLYKNEVAGVLYPDEAVGYAQEMFFVRSGDPWQYTGFPSLAELDIGTDRVLVSQDYDYGDEAFNQTIKARPELFQVLGGGNTFERAIQLLLKKRVRAVVFDRSVMAYTLIRLGLEGKIISAGAIHQGKKLYIGISEKTPGADQIKEKIDFHLKLFKSSDKYQQLLRRYNMDVIKLEGD